MRYQQKRYWRNATASRPLLSPKGEEDDGDFLSAMMQKCEGLHKLATSRSWSCLAFEEDHWCASARSTPSSRAMPKRNSSAAPVSRPVIAPASADRPRSTPRARAKSRQSPCAASSRKPLCFPPTSQKRPDAAPTRPGPPPRYAARRRAHRGSLQDRWQSSAQRSAAPATAASAPPYQIRAANFPAAAVQCPLSSWAAIATVNGSNSTWSRLYPVAGVCNKHAA